MKELIKHIKRWNCWRKHNLNGRFYQLLVLLKLTESPSMAYIWIEEDGHILDFTPALENFQEQYDKCRELYGKKEVSSTGEVFTNE